MCFMAATGQEGRGEGRLWQEGKLSLARELLHALTDGGRRVVWRVMITLSPRAANQVRTMQADLPEPKQPLRVLMETGGCSGFQYGMSFDDPKPDDARFESEGVSIIIDPTSLAYLDGSHVDFDDGLHGKGFEIKNPNAQSTCGCGKSFN
jgi:iron-sulfur cluster assembly accessory protein